MPGIRDNCFNQDITRICIDFRVEGGNLAGKGAAWIAISSQRYLLPQRKIGKLLLRQVKVGAKRIQRLQGDDLVTGIHVLSGIDGTDPQASSEGRPDGFFID